MESKYLFPAKQDEEMNAREKYNSAWIHMIFHRSTGVNASRDAHRSTQNTMIVYYIFMCNPVQR